MGNFLLEIVRLYILLTTLLRRQAKKIARSRKYKKYIIREHTAYAAFHCNLNDRLLIMDNDYKHFN